MRKVWLLLLLFAQTALAQNKSLDSLELQFSAAKNDENRLAVLKELVNTAFETDMSKAMDYARIGVDLADKAGDKKAQPAFYEMKGRMHANMLQLDSAVLFFDKAMARYKAIDNKKGQATTWFKIGWVHKKKQEIDKAMDADMKALKLMEELKDQTRGFFPIHPWLESSRCQPHGFGLHFRCINAGRHARWTGAGVARNQDQPQRSAQGRWQK